MNIQQFDFNFWPVRVLMLEEQPWFVAKDVCNVLELEPRDSVRYLDDDEKSNVSSKHIGQIGGRDPIIINESGLYSLVLRSRKPEAKKFRKWVTSEVLPAIRKHGGYLTPAKTEEILANPDLLIQLATQLKKERAEKATLKMFMNHKNELIDSLSKDSRYLRQVVEAESELTITEIAKELGMSGRALNSILIEKEIIYKLGKSYVLYAKYQDKGLTKTRTELFVHEGKQMTSWQLVWTQRGRKFIHELIRKKGR